MKKSIVKTLSAFLALVLILSALPMAAFAAESVHTHTFASSDGGEGYEQYSNTKHAYVRYTNYDCACGEDSYRTYVVLSTSDHSAAPGSQLYLGSYMGDDGSTMSTYRYTCKVCGATYTVNVKE